MGKTTYELMTESDEDMRLFQQELAIESVTSMIERLMKKDGVSRSELARRLNKTPGWVTQLLDGDRNKTIRTISDVLWALGRSLRYSAVSLERGADTDSSFKWIGEQFKITVAWQSETSLASAYLSDSAPVTVTRPRV